MATFTAMTFESAPDHAGGPGSAHIGPDAIMAQFVHALLPSEQAEAVLSGFYTDAFHASLLSRLATLREPGAQQGRRRVSPLPKWKLRKVEAHVDTKIGERILLAELASCAGLSEMHFAAQFKLATGQRPHDYVTHRRIQHARQMLGETQEPIVQIALAVGFQTQAHFTTVFKRVVGMTPNAWRRAEWDRRPAALPSAKAGDRFATAASSWQVFPPLRGHAALSQHNGAPGSH